MKVIEQHLRLSGARLVPESERKQTVRKLMRLRDRIVNTVAPHRALDSLKSSREQILLVLGEPRTPRHHLGVRLLMIGRNIVVDVADRRRVAVLMAATTTITATLFEPHQADHFPPNQGPKRASCPRSDM